MATFFNQATLSFNGRLTNSNVTAGEIAEALGAAKTALTATYGANDSVVYTVNIVNSGNAALTGIAVTDDLGAYTVGANTVYPLTYVDGSAKLFINGALVPTPTVTGGPPLVISGITVPAGANASVVYEAVTNEFAPLESGATVVNTATVTADGVPDIVSEATVTARDETNLTIAKAISPATVTDNGEITYTFVIQNTGNTPAVATDDVIVTDTFTPILNPIAVTYNAEAWAEGVNYTYDATTGEFATLPGQITVPFATYTQDAITGVTTTTPGVAVITVTGNV